MMVVDDSGTDSRRRRPWWFLPAIGGLVLGGLGGLVVPEGPPSQIAPVSAPATVDAVASQSPDGRGGILYGNELLFSVGQAQARYVVTTMAFFDAYARGHVETVKAMVTDDVVGGDCDPSTDRGRAFQGRADFDGWLANRIAESDRFVVQRIFNENPDAVTGGRVVGVIYASRESDAIRRRYAGIRDLVYRPGDAGKIVFTADGLRIVALNLGGCVHQ